MKIFINIWITFSLLAGLSRKRMIMAQKSSRYDPEKHHRRSIRYKGCDYCTPGVYFITMRTHAFQCLFGQIRPANGPKPGSIGAIIGQFKMQVTKRINALRLDKQEPGTDEPSPLRIWQRNYYDRILRDRVALQRVRTYILNNPRNAKRKPRKT